MNVISAAAIGDMTVAFCTFNKSEHRVANINLALVKSIQLILQVSRGIDQRNWKCYKREFCHLTVLFLTIVLNSTKSSFKNPLPQIIQRIVTICFPMLQAGCEIEHAVNCLKNERISEGFLSIAAIGLRVARTGYVLATASTPSFPAYHVINGGNFTNKFYRGVNVSRVHFHNCRFDQVSFYDVFFYQVAFTNSTLINLSSRKVVFLECYLENCDFSHARINGKFFSVMAKNCIWTGADLSQCIQEECSLIT